MVWWGGWLSQTRPIPRSPDGDKNTLYISKNNLTGFNILIVFVTMKGTFWDKAFWAENNLHNLGVSFPVAKYKVVC